MNCILFVLLLLCYYCKMSSKSFGSGNRSRSTSNNNNENSTKEHEIGSTNSSFQVMCHFYE